MHSRFTARISALALLCFFLYFSFSAARAQDPPAGLGFKEIQIAANSFTAADPLPSWVDRIDIPPAESGEAIVVRLADTQVLVGSAPAVFVRRAIAVNDAASLTAVGQITISFVPEYHKVQLHSVQILRGQQALDRTNSGTRFLQRERGLERGVYSGE